MLFGWLLPNTIIEETPREVISAQENWQLLEHKLNCNKSNMLKLYSKLIYKSSSKNILKIKSLLNEFQHELLERTLCCQVLQSENPIECEATLGGLRHEIASFTKKWIGVNKQDFEFMNFLVELEHIGDSMRGLFAMEDKYIHMQSKSLN